MEIKPKYIIGDIVFIKGDGTFIYQAKITSAYIDLSKTPQMWRYYSEGNVGSFPENEVVGLIKSPHLPLTNK